MRDTSSEKPNFFWLKFHFKDPQISCVNTAFSREKDEWLAKRNNKEHLGFFANHKRQEARTWSYSPVFVPTCDLANLGLVLKVVLIARIFVAMNFQCNFLEAAENVEIESSPVSTGGKTSVVVPTTLNWWPLHGPNWRPTDRWRQWKNPCQARPVKCWAEGRNFLRRCPPQHIQNVEIQPMRIQHRLEMLQSKQFQPAQSNVQV